MWIKTATTCVTIVKTTAPKPIADFPTWLVYLKCDPMASAINNNQRNMGPTNYIHIKLYTTQWATNILNVTRTDLIICNNDNVCWMLLLLFFFHLFLFIVQRQICHTVGFTFFEEILISSIDFYFIWISFYVVVDTLCDCMPKIEASAEVSFWIATLKSRLSSKSFASFDSAGKYFVHDMRFIKSNQIKYWNQLFCWIRSCGWR